jgi:hypothetical protein
MILTEKRGTEEGMDCFMLSLSSGSWKGKLGGIIFLSCIRRFESNQRDSTTCISSLRDGETFATILF